MRAKLVAGGAVVALAVVAAVVVGAWVGVDSTPGPAADADGDSFPTDTPHSGTATVDPFDVSVERVEECGQTCRDVTIVVANEQSTTAENTTVYTRVFAGNDTDGTALSENRRRVGGIEPGRSTTLSERVTLSGSDLVAVGNADGRITVQLTVQSDEETMTVTERRDVA
jgi:hypothetical protein